MKLHARAIGATLGCALIVAGADQLVKGLVTQTLMLNVPVPVISGVCNLTYRQNTGAAFSMFHTQPMAVLIAVNLIVLAIFMALVRPYLRQRLGIAAAALILGGGIGNVIDRFRLRYVVDYLDIRITPSYTWPTFNLADACVVVGVVLLMFVILHAERHAATPRKSETV